MVELNEKNVGTPAINMYVEGKTIKEDREKRVRDALEDLKLKYPASPERVNEVTFERNAFPGWFLGMGGGAIRPGFASHDDPLDQSKGYRFVVYLGLWTWRFVTRVVIDPCKQDVLSRLRM